MHEHCPHGSHGGGVVVVVLVVVVVVVVVLVVVVVVLVVVVVVGGGSPKQFVATVLHSSTPSNAGNWQKHPSPHPEEISVHWDVPVFQDQMH